MGRKNSQVDMVGRAEEMSGNSLDNRHVAYYLFMIWHLEFLAGRPKHYFSIAPTIAPVLFIISLRSIMHPPVQDREVRNPGRVV